MPIEVFLQKIFVLSAKVLLITPPFTQLNTPYPATAYLKGFLNTKGIDTFQSDLGIEVTLAIFCKQGLTAVFDFIATQDKEFTENVQRMLALKADYIQSIDATIQFLQGKNPTLADRISRRDWLPEASRFAQLDDLHWAFGTMGVQDKAKHIATMYLEDLADLIAECVDEHFGFSRYAERLGRSANSFDELYNLLQQPFTYIDQITIDLLHNLIAQTNPTVVGLSVPFPGNLYASLRCGQFIKKHFPTIKVTMGGGFANTELRSLSDARVFEFYDFITLDDGEAPVENLLKYIDGTIEEDGLKRTFLLQNNAVVYFNNPTCSDYKQHEVGTPDYNDLLLDKYISAIEVVNPMHKMWSDGRWNKLTMAHGCYWGKCTFCDISLDYIKIYEPVAASLICDRMEALIEQTGQTGFHFVDEAAPPALMRAVAIEIIKRKLVVSWWTNIRFEKSFTRDLCLLLKASGCIAVSGGLEVASDRLLQLIQKGITVAQVAKVNQHFAAAGIMVHAYLMYGFPTQTAQETIDSLEMVRQMFKQGVLQSAFWHQFAMTAHSPVGLNPEKYAVLKETDAIGSFANNDIVHTDPTGADHESFSFGLKKSLLNFMHNLGIEDPLQKWFDFKIPKTSVDPNFISNVLEQEDDLSFKASAKIIYLGNLPKLEFFTQSKKGNSREMANMFFQTLKSQNQITILKQQATWLFKILTDVSIYNEKTLILQDLKNSYEIEEMEDFEMFWDNKPMNQLYKFGLLKL